MNTEFYGSNVTAAQILTAQIKDRDGESVGRKQLLEIVTLLQGKQADVTVVQEISSEPTPGDLGGDQPELKT